MQDCRLIIEDLDSHQSGATNMSVDEVLLQNAEENSHPTLRFYGWKAPTLSLGYFQKVADRNSHEASLHCDLVRRASGGGAIMHDKELTYAFATPTNSRWSDTEQTYLAFHETLVELLGEFDIAAELHSKESGLTSDAFLCFQRRASGDVTAGGHKIMGSAQRRGKNAMLQHGSLLLAQSVYAPELPGVREIAEPEISSGLKIEVLRSEWLHKLTSRLKVNFFTGSLTDTERRGADAVRKEKFERDSWTVRR